MQKLFFFIMVLAAFSCKNAGDTNSGDMSTTADSTGMQISLAEWSFHKALFDKKMDHLGFIEKAGAMGFKGVEYVNQFFKDKARGGCCSISGMPLHPRECTWRRYF